MLFPNDDILGLEHVYLRTRQTSFSRDLLDSGAAAAIVACNMEVGDVRLYLDPLGPNRLYVPAMSTTMVAADEGPDSEAQMLSLACITYVHPERPCRVDNLYYVGALDQGGDFLVFDAVSEGPAALVWEAAAGLMQDREVLPHLSDDLLKIDPIAPIQ
ncbi:MAG: hypothetical protein KIH63_001435 [Candidatus Saccharibacteria bacterium]|nr:hypothetical protein [Candidatus Saccharibacteria bacterium]